VTERATRIRRRQVALSTKHFVLRHQQLESTFKRSIIRGIDQVGPKFNIQGTKHENLIELGKQ
jgi:hypothetical protein